MARYTSYSRTELLSLPAQDGEGVCTDREEFIIHIAAPICRLSDVSAGELTVIKL